ERLRARARRRSPARLHPRRATHQLPGRAALIQAPARLPERGLERLRHARARPGGAGRARVRAGLAYEARGTARPEGRADPPAVAADRCCRHRRSRRQRERVRLLLLPVPGALTATATAPLAERRSTRWRVIVLGLT